MTRYTWRCISWRTASSARRTPLRDLDARVPGALALHTCARDAWLVPGPASALDAEMVRLGFDTADRAEGPAALRALLRVAVGLDAAVEGEADVGRQVRAALAASPFAGAARVDHVLARLLREGRRAGWVREGDGVARLAVRAVHEALGTRGRAGSRVGVIGAGAMGARVAALLGEQAVRYNRTPGPGVWPLDALAALDAWVVATSAPAPWFVPPEAYVALVDLGHPAQVSADPRHVDLDALLAGADARLDPGLRAAAEAAVEDATVDLIRRLVGNRTSFVSEGGVAGGGSPPPQEASDVAVARAFA